MNNQYFDPTPYAVPAVFNAHPDHGTGIEEIIRKTDQSLVCRKTEDGLWQMGLSWKEARDIQSVCFELAADSPAPTRWYVEYWGSGWPVQMPPYRLGASRGWLAADDPYHGTWREVQGERETQGLSYRFAFDPLDIVEYENHDPVAVERFYQSADFNARFRRTSRIRILLECDSEPKLEDIRAEGFTVCEEAHCRIYTGVGELKNRPLSGTVSVWNGTGETKTFSAGESTAYSFVKNKNASKGDKTLLLFRFGPECTGFAVDAEDIERSVFVEEAGLLITSGECEVNPEAVISGLKSRSRSIYDRIGEHKEQTLENAFREIPEMDVSKQPPYGRYVILGWEGMRQRFCLRYNGDIFGDKQEQKVCKRDCAKIRWAGASLHFRIGTGDPVNFGEARGMRKQHMENASLPVYITEWEDRHIFWKETCFASPMQHMEGYARGDEDLVVPVRFEARNPSDISRRAILSVNLFPNEELYTEKGRIFAASRVMLEDSVQLGWRRIPHEKPLLRAVITDTGEGTVRCIPLSGHGVARGQIFNKDHHEFFDGHRNTYEATSSIPNTLLWEKELAPGESAVFELMIPYPTYTEEEEIRRLENISYESCLKETVTFWNRFASNCAHISIPTDERLNNLLKAIPWHIRMTFARDPDTGFYILSAGTCRYGACGNEACMQILLLDMLGQHQLAERYMDAFLDGQGSGRMDGDFRSAEGALIVNDYSTMRNTPDMMFGYNLDQGYIMQCLALHYRLTGDLEWLKKVSSCMIQACQFIVRERKATMHIDMNGDRVPEYGLLPPGRLEDNAEWRHWFAVNAHACAGMLACADVLKELDRETAAAIEADAVTYRGDLLAAADRASENCAVVPDGNGGYMPYIPTRTDTHGRDWGWFREAAYGPLHLVQPGVLPADDPRVTRVLRDLEDNLFLSSTWGRDIDRENLWFSQGGMTVQTNLLFNDLVYLMRNQPEYAVRVLLNDLAQNLYRDMNCFTEHPIPEFGFGYGPFFKTPDEAQFAINVRWHLLREEGDVLHVLQGAALEWLEPGKKIEVDGMSTFFGDVSFAFEMGEDGHHASLTLKGQWRKKPVISLSLRHPDGLHAVQVCVNGEQVSLNNGNTVVFAPLDENKAEIVYQ